MYFFFCFKVMKHKKREGGLRTIMRLIKPGFLGEDWLNLGQVMRYYKEVSVLKFSSKSCRMRKTASSL